MKITRSELKKLILETMNEVDGDNVSVSVGTPTEDVADPRAKLVLDAGAAVHIAMRDVEKSLDKTVKDLGKLAEPFRKAAYAEDGTPPLRDGDAFSSIAQFVAGKGASDIIALADTIQNLKDVSFQAHNDLIRSEPGPEPGSVEDLNLSDDG